MNLENDEKLICDVRRQTIPYKSLEDCSRASILLRDMAACKCAAKWTHADKLSTTYGIVCPRAPHTMKLFKKGVV